jgi:signal transduction histidine kinase
MAAMAEYGHQRSTATDDLIGRWPGKIGLAAAVGVTYFLAARLSLQLLLEPDGVAVFWPAAGISSGILIALGPHARWPVAVGVVAATVPANLMGDRNLSASIAFGLCNAAEALITAGLIHRYFGPNFNLGELRKVLGLLAAAIAGTAISGIGGAVAYRLFHSPGVPMLTSWSHWFASDAVGILTVAPLFIGIATAVRRPPVRGEILEAVVALAALAALTVIIILLPQEAWETVVPIALLAPVLLWVAARFRSVYSAASGFIVSLTVVWTTIYDMGHFGGPGLPIGDRILQAQTFVVGVMLGALVLAALFAERRRAETRLVRSNMMLEQERDNKLMNAQAIAAAIAHEVNQPVSSIVMNSSALLELLEKTPPQRDEAREVLNDIITDAFRTSKVIDSVRALFRGADESRQPIDVNEIVLGVVSLVRGELQDRGLAQIIQLAPELPLVPGNKNQLHQVILNLVHNALEAMDGIPDRTGVLQVRTELRAGDIVVTVQDSGCGIDDDKLDKIFDAFFTTKKNGTGLGLAICRIIIERHGGRLTASSDGKSGALFNILLPVERTDGARTDRQ